MPGRLHLHEPAAGDPLVHVPAHHVGGDDVVAALEDEARDLHTGQVGQSGGERRDVRGDLVAVERVAGLEAEAVARAQAVLRAEYAKTCGAIRELLRTEFRCSRARMSGRKRRRSRQILQKLPVCVGHGEHPSVVQAACCDLFTCFRYIDLTNKF